MTWTIHNDSAWMKVGAGSYRHYCGASVTKNGRLWIATTLAGNSIPGHGTALDAVINLQKSGFWCFRQFGQFGTIDYGDVRHSCSPAKRDRPQVFVFCASKEDEFPSFLKSILSRHFFGHATCAGCLSPMTEFRTRSLQLFDGFVNEKSIYLACICGYAVWQMEMDLYDAARDVMDQNARPWRRKQTLKMAGGKHSRKEIREILALQEGRCIYCNAEFRDERRPTKDHLLPLTEGGSDWALNILLACRGCNSRRGNIPFRTFCRLLTPTQNKRILMHLRRRLLALEVENISKEAFSCFVTGLAMHDPKHSRYCDIKRRATTRRNVMVNRLLPSSAVAILKKTSNA